MELVFVLHNFSEPMSIKSNFCKQMTKCSVLIDVTEDTNPTIIYNRKEVVLLTINPKLQKLLIRLVEV